MNDPTHWEGFRIVGPAESLEAAEELLPALLDETDFLGSARLAWHEPCGQTAADFCLHAYLRPEAQLERAARALREGLPDSLEIEPARTPHADWALAWREHFRPVVVSPRLAVLPAWWDQPVEDLEPDALRLRIDPGQAFGSGTHDTTRLSLALLEAACRPGLRCLDYGAGSGILSFAACLLGAESVVAIEIDPDALENYRLNAALNGCADRIDYRIGDDSMLGPDERFELVCCNVLFRRVRDALPHIVEALTDGGRLLLSGYLTSESQAVETFLAGLGLEVMQRQSRSDWAALAAVASR